LISFGLRAFFRAGDVFFIFANSWNGIAGRFQRTDIAVMCRTLAGYYGMSIPSRVHTGAHGHKKFRGRASAMDFGGAVERELLQYFHLLLFTCTSGVYGLAFNGRAPTDPGPRTEARTFLSMPGTRRILHLGVRQLFKFHLWIVKLHEAIFDTSYRQIRVSGAPSGRVLGGDGYRGLRRFAPDPRLLL
jgi:hypothetical protein